MIADIFVIFDTVQYNPRHEENRAKLKTPQGPKWATVPIRRKSRQQLIIDTYVDNAQPWRNNFLKTIESLYRKSPFYKTHIDEIAEIIQRPNISLVELDVASWEPAIRLLNINCDFVRASELPIEGKGSQLLLDICKHLGSKTYISGGFGRDYLDLHAFNAAAIEVEFHSYTYPEYQQRFGEFKPFLSYLDLLFNVEIDRDLVISAGTTEPTKINSLNPINNRSS